jgi:ankyrin repeat protein
MNETMRLLTFAALVLCIPAVSAEEAGQKPEPIPQQEVMEAALYGKTETIRKALAQGYEVNSIDPQKRTALMYAAFNGQTDIVKQLIEAGADVNAQDGTGTSALMFAASAPGGTVTVQLLLDSGARINMTDNNEHFTALMWAAAEGQAESVRLLLKYKADTTLEDIDGDTAESFAAKKGFTEIVQILQQTSAEKPETKQPEAQPQNTQKAAEIHTRE